LFSQVDAAFEGAFGGRLDVLVNNAGTGAFASLTDTTDEQFDALPRCLARATAKRAPQQSMGWSFVQ
jgi:3-oxoacyl-[acyl-carrier protein] reductase